MLVNPVGQNDELQRIGIDQSAARTHRIAILIWIGPIRGRDGPATADVFRRMSGRIGASQIPSVGGLVRIEHFLAKRSEGRTIVPNPPISEIPARPAAAVSAWSSVSSPDAG